MCYVHDIKKLLLTSLLVVVGCFFVSAQQQQVADTFYVHFDYNKFFLRDDGKQVIDSFFMNALKNGFIKTVALSGHCDSIGDNEYNDSLSIARVMAVKEYLFTKGASNRIITNVRGLGKRQPLLDNNTSENRSLNRRVEVVLNWVSKEPVTRIRKPAPPTTSVAENIEEFVKAPETKTGDQIILKNLVFLGGRHYPMQKSLPVLDHLLGVMKKYPTLKIEIQGHVCCEKNGGEGFDSDVGSRTLSVQRAKYIYEYLKASGIDEGRMQYRGFGSSRKLFAAERTAEEQEANRRVEIKILEK